MEEISGFITISNPVGIQRGLQDQDGITNVNDCFITGEFNICPAGADLTDGDGMIKRVTASLKCPLDAVDQSDFREASQNGLCSCDASIRDLTESEDAAQPLDCECFVCPGQADQFGVAYYCSSPIVGICTSFNCRGDCNGDRDLDLITDSTKAPTGAPVAPPVPSSAFNTDPTMATTALLVLCLARMLR